MSGVNVKKLGACFSLFSLCLFAAPKSHAWGKIGHETVALLAEQNLTPTAKLKVSEILQDSTMTEAALWPDEIKRSSGWSHTGPYHFADLKDSQNYLSMLASESPDAQGAGDVIRALVKSEDVLKDPASSRTEKRYALSFMIHFIGDLHQPLHEGRPEDRGGNDIPADYFGRKTNLHAIWDSNIIENTLSRFSVYNFFGKGDDGSEQYLAQLRKPTKSEISNWQDSYILDWSAEATEFRNQIYADWTGSKASQAYQNKYSDYVSERILRAGYRLAAWLNSILANQDFQAEKAASLREKLDEILGAKYSNEISLDPKNLTPAESRYLSVHFDRCQDE